MTVHETRKVGMFVTIATGRFWTSLEVDVFVIITHEQVSNTKQMLISLTTLSNILWKLFERCIKQKIKH